MHAMLYAGKARLGDVCSSSGVRAYKPVSIPLTSDHSTLYVVLSCRPNTQLQSRIKTKVVVLHSSSVWLLISYDSHTSQDCRIRRLVLVQYSNYNSSAL